MKMLLFFCPFRALSYEYLMKQDALRSIEIKREMDKGKDFEKQKFIQNFLHIEKEGLRTGMKYLEQWKK